MFLVNQNTFPHSVRIFLISLWIKITTQRCIIVLEIILRQKKEERETQNRIICIIFREKKTKFVTFLSVQTRLKLIHVRIRQSCVLHQFCVSENQNRTYSFSSTWQAPIPVYFAKTKSMKRTFLRHFYNLRLTK